MCYGIPGHCCNTCKDAKSRCMHSNRKASEYSRVVFLFPVLPLSFVLCPSLVLCPASILRPMFLHPPLILCPPTYPLSGPWLDAFVLFNPLSVPLLDMFLSSSRSCAPDMFPDEFPQSGYHVRTFPRFSRHPLGTSLELPHLRSSTGLHLNSLSISRRTSGLVPTLWIWFRPYSRSLDIMSGRSHALLGVHWALHQSCLTFRVLLNFIGCPLDFILKYGACTRVKGTAHELRPSPSFLTRPSGMGLNKYTVPLIWWDTIAVVIQHLTFH
jgi:hypothetical protein